VLVLGLLGLLGLLTLLVLGLLLHALDLLGHLLRVSDRGPLTSDLGLCINIEKALADLVVDLVELRARRQRRIRLQPNAERVNV
jgi:hypothetical protein